MAQFLSKTCLMCKYIKTATVRECPSHTLLPNNARARTCVLECNKIIAPITSRPITSRNSLTIQTA